MLIITAWVYCFYLVRSSGGKMAGGQVYKTADIEGLEFYSATFKGVAKSTSWNNAACSTIWSSERPEGITLDHLLHPFDVTASLVVWEVYNKYWFIYISNP